MRLKHKYHLIFVLGIIIFWNKPLHAQPAEKDSIRLIKIEKQEQFYDSLQIKANNRKVTGWIYDFLMTSSTPVIDKKKMALDYYKEFEGKVISQIDIKALEVFGPTFSNPEKKPEKWLERTANAIHNKSNLKTIRKQLLFELGDILDPEVLYENERIIRDLPYIKDTRIIVEQDSLYIGFVHITVLTKDRFSYGLSGGVNGTSSGDIKFYNQNIFGIGHQISAKFVGHLRKEPYLGVETAYSIRNIAGKFLDLRLGYANTYLKEGYEFNLNKPFITNDMKWGYGVQTTRRYRTNRLTENDPVQVEDPLDLAYYSAWGGRNFPLQKSKKNPLRFLLTAGFHSINFAEKPDVIPENQHFFANRTLYMAGVAFSKRQYIQDQLVYSYGITEDIPIGFKHEINYGFDANEFGDRHYLHILTSNGIRAFENSGYLYVSTGFGGFFNKRHFEEGQLQVDFGFITKLRHAGKVRSRWFARMDYVLGIRRFEIEKLDINKPDFIRGFNSDIATGKQRLAFNLEHVVFFPRQFYKFNVALFGFADMGIIGSNRKHIFKGDYYSGVGLGLRVHNENLVFETFRLRLAFYPFGPSDQSLIGFTLDEQPKQRFNSFETTQPAPLIFK